MSFKFKYDVAISVAEEDKRVAQQIVMELRKRKMRYYYYEERTAESWGEYIINLTKDAFGKRTRYVLLITSKIFIKKYWSGIEKQIAFTNPIPGKPHILQLRLDDTQIDGLSQHAVYLNWNNNPEVVSDALMQKIRKQQQRAILRLGKYCIGAFIVIIVVVLIYVASRPKHRSGGGQGPAREMQKVLVAGPFFLSTRNGTGRGLPLSQIPDSFYISNTEVTIAQYRKFCDDQKKRFPPQPPSSSENSPIVNVTWEEALSFCKWVQGRLPTEAEWEYAARANLSGTYSGGNNASKVAVYDRQKSRPVATKTSNGFGLYDMTGNVAEWCNDWYDTSFIWRSVRGGSYNSKINPVNELAIAYRSKEHPGSRSPYIGFRVAWDKK